METPAPETPETPTLETQLRQSVVRECSMEIVFYRDAINPEGDRYESPVLTANYDKMLDDDQAIANAFKQLEDAKLTAEYFRIDGGVKIYL